MKPVKLNKIVGELSQAYFAYHGGPIEDIWVEFFDNDDRLYKIAIHEKY